MSQDKSHSCENKCYQIGIPKTNNSKHFTYISMFIYEISTGNHKKVNTTTVLTY